MKSMASCSSREPERRHGFIAELYVVPSARGAGHGRALIAACEAWSRARGHKLMTIGVLAGNAGAVRAYEGAGYAPYISTSCGSICRLLHAAHSADSLSTPLSVTGCTDRRQL